MGVRWYAAAMVFGGKSNKPASKATVIFAGVFLTVLPALMLCGIAIAEPDPSAPIAAIVVGVLLALGGTVAGAYLLITGLRMKRPRGQPPIRRDGTGP